MMTPCCIKCGVKMEKITIGANVAIMARHLKDKPYQVFSADIHKCNGCGAIVVAQFADKPFWEHFHSDDVPSTDYAIWER